MRYWFIALGSFLLLVSTAAQAGPCYTKAEAEAEQGIRIHSELMVIGLNCQVMGQREGMDLYGQYRQFTADHGNLFATYEALLMKHFEKDGEAVPVKSLNLLRTNFANKISNDAAGMRPDVFCSRYAPRIISAAKMSEKDIRVWASTFYETHPVSKPICASS